MKKIVLRRISFGSYMKLVFMCAISFPLLIGFIAFIGVLFGAPVLIDGVSVQYPMSILYGGGIALFLPIGWGLVFCLFALIMFLPFRLVIHLFKGVRVNAIIEVDGEDVCKSQSVSRIAEDDERS